jgi:hypothetical protein
MGGLVARTAVLAATLGFVTPTRGAYVAWRDPFRPTRSRGSRGSVLRMADAKMPDMAQHGLLYDGWGADGLKSLNKSHDLLDHADEVGINRFDLTRIVAAQAKEIAYAHLPEEDMLNPMLNGNLASRTPKARVPYVMRAIGELKEELLEAMAVPEDELRRQFGGEAAEAAEEAAPPKPSPAEARAGAARASTGTPLVSSTSLDGDGGAANLQALNAELLQAADAEKAGASAGEGAAGAEGAATDGEADTDLSDDGFDQLLADLSEVDMDEDFDEELEDDALDSLFGNVVVDSGPGLEVRGMHPGD